MYRRLLAVALTAVFVGCDQPAPTSVVPHAQLDLARTALRALP